LVTMRQAYQNVKAKILTLYAAQISAPGWTAHQRLQDAGVGSEDGKIEPGRNLPPPGV
jgi:hypothetical protein